MKRCFKCKIVIFWFLLLLSTTFKIEAQIIVRLWEAEASALANTIALGLIKSSEVKVKDKMKKLNTELEKKVLYYGLMDVFNPIFQINPTINRINDKLLEVDQINNRIPLLFNRKKNSKRRKYEIYTKYLKSLDTDVGNDFSNNGNLLKTSLEIISELEEIEKDLDAILGELNLAERLFNMF